MFAPNLSIENAVCFSRFDEQHPLANVTRYPIELEEQLWPSAEHYFQVKIAGSAVFEQKIWASESAIAAYRINKPWYRRKKKGWKDQRRTLMTRALFIKVQMYPEVSDFLMATGDQLIVETSLYDHYWGLGRDLRGENMLGKIWMDIRSKWRNNKAVLENI